MADENPHFVPPPLASPGIPAWHATVAAATAVARRCRCGTAARLGTATGGRASWASWAAGDAGGAGGAGVARAAGASTVDFWDVFSHKRKVG